MLQAEFATCTLHKMMLQAESAACTLHDVMLLAEQTVQRFLSAKPCLPGETCT